MVAIGAPFRIDCSPSRVERRPSDLHETIEFVGLTQPVRIMVAATFNQSADEVEAFDVVGGLHAVSAATVRGGRPLIILHPAEPRYPVYTDEKASTGDAIHLAVTWEMELRSFGYDVQPYWARNCPWQQPHCGVGYWNYGSSCTLGVGTANLPKNPPVSGLSIPISPGIAASTIYAGCGAPSSQHGYWLRVVEMDGGLNGEDDFGTRVSGVSGINNGQLPYGLTVTTTSGCCSYYYLSGSGEENDNRIVSVFMALQID